MRLIRVRHTRRAIPANPPTCTGEAEANRRVRPWHRRRVRSVGSVNLAAIAGDLVAIAIGISSSFSVHLIGQLAVSEILTLVVLPFLLVLHGRRAWTPRMRIILALMGTWLLGQILTDVYRNTEPIDWMRGDALILSLAITLVALCILISKNDRRKVLIIAASALGSLLLVTIEPSPVVADDPWKWGYSGGVNLMVVLASCYFFSKRRYGITLILLTGIMLVNLLDNYRSPVLALLVTVVLVIPIIPERIGRFRLLPQAGTAMRVAVLAALAGAAGLGTLGLVRFVSNSGLISEEAKEKNEQQSQMKGGVLIGGRPEILVSSRAVFDSPVLGHGSYAKDFKYGEMLADIGESNGAEHENIDAAEAEDQGLIPTHSHLMSAWVYSGILGAVFWVYVLALMFKGVVPASVLHPPLAPLYTFVMVFFVWNILFSPFSGSALVGASIAIVVALDLLDAQAALPAAKRTPVWRRAIHAGVGQRPFAIAWRRSRSLDPS